jgi:hypothetical protein
MAGFETLTDAQTRNVLGERSAWKPYDPDSRAALGPTIESLRLASRLELGGKRFARIGALCKASLCTASNGEREP